MSAVADVMAEFAAEENGKPEVQPVVQPEKEPEKEPEKTPEPEPETTPEEPEHAPEKAPEPETNPEKTPEKEPEPEKTPGKEPEKEPKPQKDTSGFTKEEKAQFAFQRQFARQKAKFDEEKKAMQDSWNKQFSDFKKELASKNPEPRKTREQFETDDDYIDYLTQLRVEAMMAERDEKAAQEAAKAEKERKEREDAQKAAQAQADSFRANYTAAFTDPGELKAFTDLVTLGTKNGLAEVLDEAPAVRDYIFTDPNGPIVLNEMLKNRDTFVRVMSRIGNPVNATVEMHDIAREVAARRSSQPAQPTSQPPVQAGTMPQMGKPGSGVKGYSAPTIFNSDDALLEWCRKHR